MQLSSTMLYRMMPAARCPSSMYNALFFRFIHFPNHTRFPHSMPTYLHRDYMPVTLIAAYPTVTTTTSVSILLGTPQLIKCLTCKYLWPAGSSFMMAANGH